MTEPSSLAMSLSNHFTTTSLSCHRYDWKVQRIEKLIKIDVYLKRLTSDTLLLILNDFSSNIAWRLTYAVWLCHSTTNGHIYSKRLISTSNVNPNVKRLRLCAHGVVYERFHFKTFKKSQNFLAYFKGNQHKPRLWIETENVMHWEFFYLVSFSISLLWKHSETRPCMCT